MSIQSNKVDKLIQVINQLDFDEKQKLLKGVLEGDLETHHLFVLHDTKNKVQLIEGFYHLMRNSIDDEKTFQQYMSILGNYIIELKILMTKYFNKNQMHLQTIHSQELFEELREPFYHLLQDVNFISKITPFTFTADKMHIKRILYNLLKNAYESNKSVNLRIELTMYEQDGICYFIVKDNGSGIPLEIQDKIFYETVTTKADGYGIGLKVCKHLAELHQGTLTCLSSDKNGTTFQLAIPKI